MGSRLCDVADVIMGQSPPGETCNVIGKGLPLLNGPTEFGPTYPTPVQFTIDARKIALPGDLLFCVRGSTTGRMNWADQEYAIGRGVAAIRHKTIKGLQPFIRAVIQSQLPALLQSATGSTFPNVSGPQLGELLFPAMGPDEQLAISSLIGSLDNKIELNRQMNETLEAIAKALFKTWFVDFDPVRAKLDTRQPPGLDPVTAALFPSHFDHDALGLVPKGWHRKRWGDIATLEYGKSLRDYRQVGGKYRVFGTDGPIGFTDKALCNRAGIIIGRKGAYRGVHYSPEPFFVIDTAFYLKPKLSLDLKWAYYELLRFDINSMDSGSAIPSTSRNDFNGIPVIVPPHNIQNAYGEIVESFFAKVYANDRESRTLATIRDTLLPKLFSGEIRARRTEKTV